MVVVFIVVIPSHPRIDDQGRVGVGSTVSARLLVQEKGGREPA